MASEPRSCAECGASGTATDFCEECGTALDASTAAGPTPPAAASGPTPPAAASGPTPPAAASGPPAPPAETCVVCGAVRDGRFCEECGHDTTQPVLSAPAATVAAAAPAPAPARTWTVVVSADQAWFDEVRARNGPDAADMQFPAFSPERRFTLTGGRLMIGRRSRSRGIEPEIDLTGPPLDPGVSTLHAVLLPTDDGRWQIADLESTNGTSVGDSDDLLTPHTPHQLADGDRIKIGAWTVLTVHRS